MTNNSSGYKRFEDYEPPAPCPKCRGWVYTDEYLWERSRHEYTQVWACINCGARFYIRL